MGLFSSAIVLVGAAPPSPTEEIDDAANSLLDNVGDALPRITAALVVVIVGWVLSRLLRAALRRVFNRHQTPSFAQVMSKVIGWIFLFLAVLIAMAIGFPSVKPVDLLAGLGFFSVAIGFAFQDILENTLSGVLLLFRQPFESGDQIEVQEQAGTVEGITIRETRIRAFDGELIIIPNRDVYKNVIVVNTSLAHRRQRFVVGIAYENDADEATAAIATALAGVDGVAREPAPVALVEELGVSTVDIVALFWTNSRQFDAIVIRDRAITAVKKKLDAAGIEMPADIVVLQATPSFKAAVQGDQEVTPAGSLAARSADTRDD